MVRSTGSGQGGKASGTGQQWLVLKEPCRSRETRVHAGPTGTDVCLILARDPEGSPTLKRRHRISANVRVCCAQRGKRLRSVGRGYRETKIRRPLSHESHEHEIPRGRTLDPLG